MVDDGNGVDRAAEVQGISPRLGGGNSLRGNEGRLKGIPIPNDTSTGKGGQIETESLNGLGWLLGPILGEQVSGGGWGCRLSPCIL
jgi:hypothetical protein